VGMACFSLRTELLPVVGMAGENRAGAVDLLEGNNQGEFVLEGEEAEGPEEVGLIEEALVMSIGTADDDGRGAGGLLPFVEFRGELAAGELWSVLVEDDAEMAFAAGEEVGGFAGAVGGFDGDVLERRVFGEAGEVFVAAGFGVGEGGFADGEQQPFHGYCVED
jgi:hypothetical protein